VIEPQLNYQCRLLHPGLSSGVFVSCNGLNVPLSRPNRCWGSCFRSASLESPNGVARPSLGDVSVWGVQEEGRRPMTTTTTTTRQVSIEPMDMGQGLYVTLEGLGTRSPLLEALLRTRWSLLCVTFGSRQMHQQQRSAAPHSCCLRWWPTLETLTTLAVASERRQ
jgi:hypothetical protein